MFTRKAEAIDEGTVNFEGTDATLRLDVPNKEIAALLLGRKNEEFLIIVESADLRTMGER
jgi:hypothetical protein